MSAWDPNAATAAYLANLPHLDRAIAYTHGSEWLLLWGSLAGIASGWLILRSGFLVKLRALVSGPSSAVFLCTIAFFLLDWIIRFPLSLYADWWRERSYQLTQQAFTGWLAESLLAAAINAAGVGLLAMAVYAIIRRAPRRWWAWSGLATLIAIVFLVVISPIAIEPLFNRYQPAPAGPILESVTELARRARVPSNKVVIYDGSKQSERYTARVSGLFGTARIAMSDAMWRHEVDLSEVRAVVGHEMGHYEHQHALVTAAALSLLAMASLMIADRMFPVVCRWADRDKQVAGLSDPAGLPILMMIFAALGLLASPITNTLTRMEEEDADRFSLEYAHEPDGMARALVKTAIYRAPSPAMIEEVIFYNHPSIERRVRRAMLWKAEHSGLAGK